MITSVATFRWQTELSAARVAAIVEALSTLPSQIDVIRSLHAGSDVGVSDKSFDFAVVATFDDLDGFRTYVNHAAHERVAAEFIRPQVAEAGVVQFET